MIRAPALAAVLGLASSYAALAIGPPDPPVQTETTRTCPEGTFWDTQLGRCMGIRNSQLDEADLVETARELAYANRYDDAIALLNMSTMPEDSMILTYLGFAHRRAGRMDIGLAYYDRALAADPDNLLARAYLGMAHLTLGQLWAAQGQLAQIRVRGGVGTWPHRALSEALANTDGTGFDY
ncbi:MAG: hypothetical protein AAF376_04525 [Pseudomonadota bacterium]